MKRYLAAALALLTMFCPVAMTQAKEQGEAGNSQGLTETVSTMRVIGELTFGPDGKVTKFNWREVNDPAVDAYIKKTIMGWKFQPYLRDGIPVSATIYFQMTLAAHAKGDDRFEISVDNTFFYGPPSLNDLQRRAVTLGSDGKPKCVENCLISMPRKKPDYPPGLAKAGVSGAVMVHLYLNPDGTVADAMVAQSALYNVRGDDRVLDEALKTLEQESLDYARKLRAAPGSGSPLAGDSHLVAAIPFIFRMEGQKTDNLGVWRLEQRGKRSVAPWLVHDPKRWIGVSDTAGNGFMAMKDSPYKLVPEETHTP